jgi:hypothetical protein
LLSPNLLIEVLLLCLQRYCWVWCHDAWFPVDANKLKLQEFALKMPKVMAIQTKYQSFRVIWLSSANLFADCTRKANKENLWK